MSFYFSVVFHPGVGARSRPRLLSDVEGITTRRRRPANQCRPEVPRTLEIPVPSAAPTAGEKCTVLVRKYGVNVHVHVDVGRCAVYAISRASADVKASISVCNYGYYLLQGVLTREITVYTQISILFVARKHRDSSNHRQ